MILPKEITKIIMSFHSHPTADIMKVVIDKYLEVLCMRCKNPYCHPLSFYKTWCNIELDQGRIDKMKEALCDLRMDADF